MKLRILVAALAASIIAPVSAANADIKDVMSACSVEPVDEAVCQAAVTAYIGNGFFAGRRASQVMRRLSFAANGAGSTTGVKYALEAIQDSNTLSNSSKARALREVVNAGGASGSILADAVASGELGSPF